MTRAILTPDLPTPSGFQLIRCDASDGHVALQMGRQILEELAKEGKAAHYIIDETDEEFFDFFRKPEFYPLGVLDPNNALVAVGVASHRQEPIQKYLPFIPAEDVQASSKSVGYIEFIQVAANSRGRGFQRLLFAELEKWLRAQGTLYATGSVSPENQYSLNNFKSQGYREAGRYVVKDLNYPRILMVKKL